ncbi:MAG: hypothetical protein WCJ30_05020 [Deltaproteobacteria bacterium]
MGAIGVGIPVIVPPAPDRATPGRATGNGIPTGAGSAPCDGAWVGSAPGSGAGSAGLAATGVAVDGDGVLADSGGDRKGADPVRQIGLLRRHEISQR